MKFTCSAEINAPNELVAALFIQEATMKACQEGFIEKKPLTGEPWAVGSTSRLVYKKLELVETILLNELPNTFKARYEHKHMTNTMQCTFVPLDGRRTRLDQEIHYTEFKGMAKLFSWLFPGMFKRQVQKWLDIFKNYAEEKAGS